MSTQQSYDLAVVGAGILGLAHALAAARRGLRVALIDRSERAVGASVRNFGLIWPIGQPAGPLLQRALRAREVWLELKQAAGLPVEETGSLQVARHPTEMAVLEEFVARNRESGYDIALLTPDEAVARSPLLRREGLLGALWSGSELIATSPLCIRALPGYLAERYGVTVMQDCAVTRVESGLLHSERGTIRASRIVVCSGPDLQTLFPEVLKDLVVCKLQMLSAAPLDPAFRLGPGLCAGLTLLHYDAFLGCTDSLPAYRQYAEERYPEQRRWGVHVLVSQHAGGELIIGDSHEYSRTTVEPFDREEINVAILDYLNEFAQLPPHRITRRWQGVYPKLKGGSELVVDPLPGVTVVNAPGGAGMTLSFGLAEEVLASRL
ncbi:TIGR03364 family FAD-dependent oxidoreductase [Solimonas sp. K1W22B-7]|uniref:TIGR03364 family FAD-dependent oxidoreductase n=1 Tax=Solimonas sp. K1W22B-7 TaxID=2303331 RepID=UPI000E32FFE6|nr:TIGR03364 family FAD-dependent oxidoreductase [Solimonas sp. K1W22B-7]AXQ28924.1 TIGR03364 family FAD-dependent oxidoreductase [Solimonas sp. K1W22B-7]